ncbi:MAG TPA: hypothetical protein VGH76_25160, partial [Actinomycetospora sp.]|uniref:hypothetical protein n=1 Tax=Actinomycetospora sp. TaxID=1872135 RepID=UPI002F48696B
YVEAYLALEKRKDVKDGMTRHWMTPVLDVDITPQQMLAAAASAGQLGPADQRSITPPTTRQALTSGQAPPPPGATIIDPDSITEAVMACETPDQLRDLWRRVSGKEGALQDPRNAEAAAMFAARAEEIKPPPADAATAPERAAPPEPAVAADPEIEALWTQISAGCPKGWSSEKLETEFEAAIGVAADEATADQMRSYLELSTGGAG